MNMNPECAWHKDDHPYESPDEIACPWCQRLIETKRCDGCDKYFIDWEFSGFDDFVAGAAATSLGDFCCTYCLPDIEREVEEANDEDGWYDFLGYSVTNSFNLPDTELSDEIRLAHR